MHPHAKTISMNVAFSKPMTLAEFLDWEEQQPPRYELDGFQPVAMTGGTAAHADIQANIAASLRGRLRGKPCKYYGNDLKIEAAGHIRYPDGFAVCSPVANASTVVRHPVVIFEVLSPGTSSTDRIVKNQEYRATLSIQRYIILEQDRIAATVFARTGGEWSGRVVLDDAVLSMPEIGIEVPLAEFYEGLALGIPGDVKETGHTDYGHPS